MPKTVTLRMDDEVYKKVKKHAELDHRPLANFIENALRHYVDEADFVGESEMLEVLGNSSLIERIRKGSRDASAKKGRFVD
jgi:predicted DNA-binding protein